MFTVILKIDGIEKTETLSKVSLGMALELAAALNDTAKLEIISFEKIS